MKKIPVLMLAVLLAACGGKSDTAASQADAGLPPKPSFKVKFIDSTVTQGLPLGKASEDKTNDGKKRLSYAIEGMDAQNVLEVVGNRPEDLEVVSGRCMQTDGQGGKIGLDAGRALPCAVCETGCERGGRCGQADRLSGRPCGAAALSGRAIGLCGRAERALYSGIGQRRAGFSSAAAIFDGSISDGLSRRAGLKIPAFSFFFFWNGPWIFTNRFFRRYGV